MSKFRKHIFFLTLLSVVYVSLTAQVMVKASASRDKILIGEPVTLTVEAYAPLGSDIQWFSADSIEHFMITKRSAADSSNTMDGKKISQTFIITSFDSGRWSVPPFRVMVAGQPYYSDSLGIDVGFISFDPKEDYRDIKDIIVVENPWLKYIPWIVAAVAALSVVIIFLLWNKANKKPVVTAPVNSIKPTAYEDAMRALAELKRKGVVDGNEKAYYSEMNDILRRFVSNKFGISTLERTNEELIMQLSKMDLPQKSFNSLMQSLRISDFVKFAKFRPSEKDNLDNLDIVKSSVDILNNYSGSAV